jgi:hypothetical protein
MTFAKLTSVLGLAAFGAGAIGAAGTAVMGAGAVLLLIAAIAGAVALEERDSVQGLVVHDLSAPRLTTRDAPRAETFSEEAVAA